MSSLYSFEKWYAHITHTLSPIRTFPSPESSLMSLLTQGLPNTCPLAAETTTLLVVFTFDRICLFKSSYELNPTQCVPFVSAFFHLMLCL